MPNWCSNTLVLEHDDPAMLERARAGFNKGGLLNEFIPVPKELVETIAGSFSDPAKQDELNRQTHKNIDTYGYANWYDFCVAEWGTKWDVGEEDGSAEIVDGQLQLTFDSAWAPPIRAFKKLEDMGFKVTATYYEPGMAFAGKYENGEDDCYEYSGMSSEEAREYIPQELQDEFGMVDDLAEWESESDDE